MFETIKTCLCNSTCKRKSKFQFCFQSSVVHRVKKVLKSSILFFCSWYVLTVLVISFYLQKIRPWHQFNLISPLLHCPIIFIKNQEKISDKRESAYVRKVRAIHFTNDTQLSIIGSQLYTNENLKLNFKWVQYMSTTFFARSR